jgi:anaerobic selenocysteine-containing dehydrogenase
VFLENGRIVEIFGDEEHPTNKGSLCPKGMLTHFQLANPHRITSPQIRDQITDPFRSVTWDEAIAFVADKVSRQASTLGKDSLYLHGSETDPLDYLAGAAWFARLFGTSNVPERFFPRPFGPEGAVQKMFGIPASMLLTNSPRDWCHSACILVYGSDPAMSDPMTFGPLMDARDRGTTLLVIDSRKTVTASKATLSLRVKPGSEAVALKGILHLLLGREKLDEESMGEARQAIGRLKAELQSYTPETVARACWVDAADIVRMAECIARAKPVQVIAGDWHSRRSLSDEDLVLCAALVCAKASIGVPGGGVNILNASPFLRQTWPGSNGDGPESTLQSTFSINLESLLLDHQEAIGTLICRGNPCARLAGGTSTKASFREIPLVVHLSTYPNETQSQAHVSFPLSSWLEHPGLVAANNGRAIQWQHKVVEPPGECRSPLEFWTALARAVNADASCPWRDDHGNVDAREAANYFLANNPLTKRMRVDELDPELRPPGGILWPCVDRADLTFEDSRLIKGNVRGKNILFQKRENFPQADSRFPTPSGNIEFPLSVAKPEASQSTGQNNGYPLLLTTGVLVDSTEESGCFATDKKNGSSVPVIKIHPRLAKLIGVSGGELLTLENGHGTLTAPAWLSDDVDPRTVWCPEGIDPHQPFFSYESPRTLFDVPAGDAGARKFARVTAYKAGADREAAKRPITGFLKELESQPFGK